MIEKNKVNYIKKKLTEAGQPEQVIEETYGGQPLKFIFGVGTMLPKFEENIAGLNVGDKFNFQIEAKDAYGEVDKSAVVELPKDVFKDPEGKIDPELIQAGKILPMQDKDGNRFDGLIVEVNENTVKMDFNHPLAGVNLNFEGEITEVREASELELEHGHVHGEGGHQH